MQLNIELAKNEKGSALMIVLFVLVMVSAMGLAASVTTTTDIIISGNGKTYKQNLLRANGSVMEAAAKMAGEPDPKNNLMPANISGGPNSQNWLIDGTSSGSNFDPEIDGWNYAGNNENAAHSTIYTDNSSGFSVVFKGVAPGASYDMTQPDQLWEYSVYGRSEMNNGKIIVNSGYRQRF